MHLKESFPYRGISKTTLAILQVWVLSTALSARQVFRTRPNLLSPSSDLNSNATVIEGRLATTRNIKNGSSIPISFCGRKDIIEGSWVPTTMRHPPYISKTEHLRCYPHDDYRTGQWHTYDWKPKAHCKLSKWDKHQFCSIMNLSTVLIVGDSLSWEHYSSLGQLLGMRIHQSSQFEAKDKNLVQFGCHNMVRLAFRRDDNLSHVSDAIDESFPQVLVLNRGAHYQNDTKLMQGMKKVIEDVKDWKSKCHAARMKCHLFWRTTVPGHPLCALKNFSVPNNDLDAMESWIANLSNYDDHTIKYHWYDYQHQNNMVLNTLRGELGEDSFEIIDAYYLNIRRPDEHRAHQGDCLHSCYPGKMDVYSRLLLHYLRRGGGFVGRSPSLVGDDVSQQLIDDTQTS